MHVIFSEALILWYKVLARYKSAMLIINTTDAITGSEVPFPAALYINGTEPVTDSSTPIRCVSALPGSLRKLLPACSCVAVPVFVPFWLVTDIVPSELLNIVFFKFIGLSGVLCPVFEMASLCFPPYKISFNCNF